MATSKPRQDPGQLGYARKRPASPLFSYPSLRARTREALEGLKAHSDWDPCHGLKMEYIDPTTGGPAIPTISTFIQLLPKGFTTASYRSTDGAVFAVAEGRGSLTIGAGNAAKQFRYVERDTFAVPCWAPARQHLRPSSA